MGYREIERSGARHTSQTDRCRRRHKLSYLPRAAIRVLPGETRPGHHRHTTIYCYYESSLWDFCVQPTPCLVLNIEGAKKGEEKEEDRGESIEDSYLSNLPSRKVTARHGPHGCVTATTVPWSSPLYSTQYALRRVLCSGPWVRCPPSVG